MDGLLPHVSRKQWKAELPSYRHALVINLVFRVIQSQVPILTDSLPKFEFLPQNPEDYELSQILNQLAESDWTRYNWLMQLCEIILDSYFYGAGFGYWGWDAKAELGTGGPCHHSWDPFYVFPDPDAIDINGKKTRDFTYAEPVELDILKSEYPEMAPFLKADAEELVKDSDKTNIHNSRFKSPVDNLSVLEGSTFKDAAENTKALKICYWERDESVEEVEESVEKMVETTDEQGLPYTHKVIEKQYVKRKKYPNGRYTVMSNNVILEDGPIEYEDGKVPAARLVNYQLPREFWGISEVEQIEGPQQIYNKIYSFVLDVLQMTGNPIFVISKDSGIDTDNVFNRPGMILEPANAQARVDRVEGTQLQPYVLNLLDRIKSEIDDIGGSEDVSRGVKPEGVQAARAIEALQDTAQTRLRQKARFIDSYLQESGQLYLSRIFQYINAPRVYRQTNKDNVTKYFKFHVESYEQEDGTVKKVAKVRDFVQNDDGTASFGDEREYQIQGEFDVKVSTGSSLPFAKDAKFNQAMQLVQIGAIDNEEVLKSVDWPNYEAVLARVQEQQAAAAQAEMEAQATGQAV